jgi:hypothetical protein
VSLNPPTGDNRDRYMQAFERNFLKEKDIIDKTLSSISEKY